MALVHGAAFGMSPYLRISYATDDARPARGLRPPRSVRRRPAVNEGEAPAAPLAPVSAHPLPAEATGTAPLRPGRDDDASGIIDLIGSCWAEYPGCVMDVDAEYPEFRALASYFAAKGGALWVSEAAGRIVGMVGTAPHAGAEWHLTRMYVAASQRGGALARLLLRTAEDHARAAGATEMRLWSDSRFDRAHRFYERQGYVRSGPILALNDLSNSIDFPFWKPLTGIVVRALDVAAATSAERGLAALLVDVVAAGGSVSFLPPLDPEIARRFWHTVSTGVATGARILLAAWCDGTLVGTVQLCTRHTQNQPHRAEIAKLLVLPHGPATRRRPRAHAGSRAPWPSAAGRDAAHARHAGGRCGGGAVSLDGLGRGGADPGFAVGGDGGLHDTVLFWKHVRGLN